MLSSVLEPAGPSWHSPFELCPLCPKDLGRFGPKTVSVVAFYSRCHCGWRVLEGAGPSSRHDNESKSDNRLGPDVRTRPGFSARPGAVGRRPSRFRRSDRGGSLCPDTRHALTLYMSERDPRPAVSRSTVEDRCPIGEGSLSDTGRALSFLNPTGTGSIEPALDGTIYPMSRPCPP